jgi:hypothetical protein
MLCATAIGIDPLEIAENRAPVPQTLVQINFAVVTSIEKRKFGPDLPFVSLVRAAPKAGGGDAGHVIVPPQAKDAHYVATVPFVALTKAGCLPDDSLMLEMRMSRIDPAATVAFSSLSRDNILDPTGTLASIRPLMNDFQTLLSTGDLSDVEFWVDPLAQSERKSLGCSRSLLFTASTSLSLG